MAEIDECARPSVRQVCQDFMVREDGALAQRLQEEEFGNHYLRNRSERKTVREDVKAAKITYLEEVRSAQILPVAEVHNMLIKHHLCSIIALVLLLCENDDSGVREKAHRRSRERQDENHRSGFFVTLCSSWRNGCSVYSGCYRTRLGSTGRLRRHIILRWGNRNVVTRDTRKAASRLCRKGKRRRWKGDFVGAKARIRRLHFDCLAEQYKLNADFLLFFRSC
ncbi:uncharacterized protein [Montipora capricornis]|uniref:uncharacterized protein isoform X2 n=1 Tax=Montipora capricornis TaxID=246305 RepID=UPI0035F1879A